MTVLWTIFPVELVLEEEQPTPVYEELEYANGKMLVEKLSPVQCRVVRLLTTDPQDYLCPKYQPGTIITYKPVI